MTIQIARAGAQELGYAEITSTFTQTGAGNSDVTGLSVTVTVGTRPIVIEVGADTFGNTSASGITQVRIMEGGTAFGVSTSTLTAVQLPLLRKARLSPSAGSHTYKVNILQAVTGNSQILATTGDPAYIWVREV